MKLKNLLLSVLAVSGLFVGCAKEELDSLSDIQVSKSLVTISEEGGSATIDLNTAGDWKLEVLWGKDAKKWLTIKPSAEAEGNSDSIEGTSGKSTLVFTADKTVAYRSVEAYIHCNGQRQVLTIAQGENIPAPATVKEIREGIDGAIYLVSGKIVEIQNTVYGNWLIKDDSSADPMLIYGTLDNNGQSKNFVSLGLEVGDYVTVKGPRSTYNNAPQLKNVTVLDIKKNLVAVNKTSVISEHAEGDDIEIQVALKGKTIAYKASEWISIKEIKPYDGKTPKAADTTVYVFHTAPYMEKTLPRHGEITFASTIVNNRGNIVAESDVTVKVEQYGITPEPSKIADAATLKGEWVAINGTVVTTNKNGYIFTDGADFIYIREKDTKVKAEKSFKAVQTLKSYNKFYQMEDPVILPCGKVSVPDFKPTELTEALLNEIKEQETEHIVIPFVAKGVLGKGYKDVPQIKIGVHCIAIKDLADNKVYADLMGQEVVIKGYAYQYDTDHTTLAVMATSVATVAAKELPYAESFGKETGLGEFELVNIALPEGSTFVWKHTDFKNDYYMQASAFISGKGRAAESNLTSPEIDLTKAVTATLTFSHAFAFGKKDTWGERASVLIQVAGSSTWEKLNYGALPTENHAWVDATIDLKDYVGKKVKIAFNYKSIADDSPQWRIKNFEVK